MPARLANKAKTDKIRVMIAVILLLLMFKTLTEPANDSSNFITLFLTLTIELRFNTMLYCGNS